MASLSEQYRAATYSMTALFLAFFDEIGQTHLI